MNVDLKAMLLEAFELSCFEALFPGCLHDLTKTYAASLFYVAYKYICSQDSKFVRIHLCT